MEESDPLEENQVLLILNHLSRLIQTLKWTLSLPISTILKQLNYTKSDNSF